MNKFLILTLTTLCAQTYAYADNNIVIGKDTKVFETTIAKDEYAAVNQNDEPIMLRYGMAFAIKENKSGWYVVEYTQGVRGMVMQNVVADEKLVSIPKAGTYKVTNNPSETVVITNDGNTWSLKSGAKVYSGKSDDNSVLFITSDGKVMYSLSNLSGKAFVFNYDNSITKFF